MPLSPGRSNSVNSTASRLHGLHILATYAILPACLWYSFEDCVTKVELRAEVLACYLSYWAIEKDIDSDRVNWLKETVRLPEWFYRWYSWAVCFRHDAFHTLFINIPLAYSEVSCNHSFVMQLSAGGSLFRFNLWLIKNDYSVGKVQLQSSSIVIFRGFCFCEINVQFSKGSLLSWG